MNTIRFTFEQFSSLKEYLLSFPNREAAAFVIAGSFTNDSGVHFTARHVMVPERKDYDIQDAYHIQVSPIFFNRVISMAEKENMGVIICHSHPWARKKLAYSLSDDYGEKISTKTLTECLRGKPVASLLISNVGIIGRIRALENPKPIQVDQIRLVDRHLRFLNTISLRKKNNEKSEALYSRQILTFGRETQEILEDLRIGIVGLGGVGSSIAEQLARLGIRKMILVDKDNFEPSNLSRVYGSCLSDLKKSKSKVTIVERNLKEISTQIEVESIYDDVISQKVLTRLKNCDIIFSCTDKHSPRSVLNEIAYQFFIPVIDSGAGLDVSERRLRGGTIRVSLISPSLPCLFCLNIIRSDIIAAELLPVEERKAREKEGYIKGMSASEAPSLVSFTTTAAGYAVNLLIDILCNYIDNSASNYALDLRSFLTSRFVTHPKNDCVCSKRLGRADYMPLSAP